MALAVVALGGSRDGKTQPPIEAITAWMNDRQQEAADLLQPLQPVVTEIANVLIRRANHNVPGDELRGLYEKGGA